jgi:protein SCO1/2
MWRFVKQYRTLWLVLGPLSVIIVILMYTALKPVKRLPIYQPAMVNKELVDSSIQHQINYHKIAPFNLINQNGDIVTEQTFDNKIYIADFFFTTCPSICPIMTKNMADIQDVIRDDPEVMLLSHTVTPDIDSVAQLRAYANLKGVLDNKWHLVTGDKKQIYELARKSYLAVKEDGDGGPNDMIHTENFMLIDKEKRIRGYYDGTNDEEIKRLLDDIKILKTAYLD